MTANPEVLRQITYPKAGVDLVVTTRKPGLPSAVHRGRLVSVGKLRIDHLTTDKAYVVLQRPDSPGKFTYIPEINVAQVSWPGASVVRPPLYER
ncbi:hypothetical protein [Spirosoma sordidisoli]|uniref:Uncharacterized protein n=1 Tax=Spirosoma sordidisoli TaxID=2502893 RepID=A0A4Q2UG33_9BACT|nr:hypothetical protein [Spirosoma sordidisoli]RYC66331.1 hypothetical protein EQG79_30110 [Spirosoma sordidisoli]